MPSDAEAQMSETRKPTTIVGLRRSGRAPLCGRLLLPTVLLTEAFNAARRIDHLGLAGIERVAGCADVGADVGDGGACLERIAARAVDPGGGVQRMDIWFHWVIPGMASLQR